MQPHYTFHHELVKLRKKIMQLGTMVEERVRLATSVIVSHDQQIIQQILLTDYEIDELEVEIEEDCLKVLALHQPVASDLRFIITIIKINSEIERIGDMAVSIALRVKTISECGNNCHTNGHGWMYDYSSMSEKVITMLKMSLDALVNRDAALARKIFLLDDEIDAILKDAYVKVCERLRTKTEEPSCLISIYLLARHLERIGDRSTNIAENVIHLVEGTIVRCA